MPPGVMSSIVAMERLPEKSLKARSKDSTTPVDGGNVIRSDDIAVEEASNPVPVTGVGGGASC